MSERTTTTNYNLIKPQYNETADIADINDIIDGVLAEAIKYTSQSLTSSQKAQARSNIGLTLKSFSGSTGRKTLTVNNDTSAVLFVFSRLENLCGIIIVYCSMTGTVSAKSFVEDLYTAGHTGNTLYLDNNETGTFSDYTFKALIFSGDIANAL